VKVMKIGVMPREEFMARTIAIARGDFKPAADDPKVYMESLSCVAQLLSNENLKVLKLIQETNPTSLKEIAEATGRSIPSLSRTVKNMENHGIVTLEKQGKFLSVKVNADSFLIQVNI
jgi:predicted transcriptional regulator